MKKFRVRSVTSNKATIEDDNLNHVECYLRGRHKQKFKRNLNFLRVGDFVTISNKESETCIEEVLPRESKFSRAMPNYEEIEQVIAANIDQIILINSFVNPEFKLGLIDRYITLAESNHLPIIICFNKADLVEGIDVSDVLDVYRSIGYEVIVTSYESSEGIGDFKELLENKVTVLSGHSGVGKSSLINAIKPELDIRTHEISGYNEKGQHTTTLSVFHRLSKSTAIIDTPGIKELALWGIQKDELSQYFIEFNSFSEQCKFYNCSHRHEPKCAVRNAVESDQIYLTRYENYLYMYEELEMRESKRFK